MPTIQEIIAKRNELQKSNPNATNVDARNALSSTSTANQPQTNIGKTVTPPVQNPPITPPLPTQTATPQTIT